MKPKMILSENDVLNRLQFAYTPDVSAPVEHVSVADILSGQPRVFKTLSQRPAQVWLGDPHANQESLNARDLIYAKSKFAGLYLDASQSVYNVMAQELARSRPAGPAEKRKEFSRTILDDNLVRLRAFYYDLQRPHALVKDLTLEDYKKAVAIQMTDLAKECREYVMEASKGQSSKDLRSILSPAELETVQNFNHLQRVMSTVFNLQPEDAEIYWDPKIASTVSLDDEDTGGMNKAYGAVSYAGTNRAFYMRYMPYYILSAHAPLFRQALSRPKQLAASTTRPGPLKVPEALADRFGIPKDVGLSYHSISRYGLSNQKDEAVGNVPMRFYYTYPADGVTKVLELGRAEHQFIQLANRPPMTIPPKVIENEQALEAKYVHYDRKHGYGYQVGDKRVYVTQPQHQQILHHNAELLGSKVEDPNAPVHFTTDGALSVTMNKIFNENGVRVVSHDNQMWAFIPEGYKEKMQLMGELTELIRPMFEREQGKLQELRESLFQEYMAHKITKDEVEDRCRKAAVEALRRMADERRMAIPADVGKFQINRAIKGFMNEQNKKIVGIDDAVEDIFAHNANTFARVATSRYLYAAKISPFYEAIQAEQARYEGKPIDPLRVIDNLPEEQRSLFDSYLHDVQDRLRQELRPPLRAIYWGAVTQHLMDLNYGPEGLIREGPYIGRENLPTNGKEFMAYLDQHAPELNSDPIQVGTRLKKTLAYFKFQVSPYYKLPWPNLYRQNDFLERQRKVAEKTKAGPVKDFKPTEPDVTLSIQMGNVKVRLNGREERPQRTGFRPYPQRAQRKPAAGPTVPSPEPSLTLA